VFLFFIFFFLDEGNEDCERLVSYARLCKVSYRYSKVGSIGNLLSFLSSRTSPSTDHKLQLCI